jgi:lipoate-protein ligase A
LQHGTLPLGGDLTRITRALRFPDPASRQQAAARLLQKACTLESVLGRIVGWEEAAAAFEQAFAERFDIEWVPGTLSEAELARAEALMQTKYAHPDWLQRI